MLVVWFGLVRFETVEMAMKKKEGTEWRGYRIIKVLWYLNC